MGLISDLAKLKKKVKTLHRNVVEIRRELSKMSAFFTSLFFFLILKITSPLFSNLK